MYGTLLKMEIKRTLSRWQSWVALILFVGFLIQGYESFYPEPTFEFLDPNWFNVFVAFTQAHGVMPALLSFVLPLIAVMVAGDSLAWDRKTGFLQSMLMRMNYQTYIRCKIFSVSMVTFVFIWIGEFIGLIYGMVRFPVLFPPQFAHGIAPDYAQHLFMAYPVLYILLIIFNTGMAAVAFSTIALAISTKVKNLYAVLALPWPAFIVLEFISQVLGGRLSPMNYIGPYLRVVFQYTTIEIPLFWTVLWILSWMTTYLLFRRDFSRSGQYAQ